MEKEYFYIGHYIDSKNRYILKVGTTNDLDRRRKEHNNKYESAYHCPMMDSTSFEYDWTIKLSKYNTLRIEDRTRKALKDLGIGTYINNDRFCCVEKPEKIVVKIKKTYEVVL